MRIRTKPLEATREIRLFRGSDRVVSVYETTHTEIGRVARITPGRWGAEGTELRFATFEDAVAWVVAAHQARAQRDAGVSIDRVALEAQLRDVDPTVPGDANETEEDGE